MNTTRLASVLMMLLMLAGCAKAGLSANPSEAASEELPSTIGDENDPIPVDEMPLDDSKISLDSFGETFQSAKADALQSSHYMEKNCNQLNEWNTWKKLPMKYCRYNQDGQPAEVLMLNAGPRRLTLWLQDACSSFARNFSQCMEKTFNHFLNQSGGQFPVAGVVIEDMDGNGRGNSYVFRNGVTVSISSIGNGSESILNSAQIAKSFTDPVRSTYTYARPVSVTREQITAYASNVGMTIPALGSSSARQNNFNALVADFYQKAWRSSQNHLIRAWVNAQNF